MTGGKGPLIAAGKLSSQVVHRPLAAIHINPRNARTHSKRQIKGIADSVRAFGYLRPLLLDEKGVLLYGHGSLAAARLVGLETVPTLTATGLSDAQKRAFAIADNKLAETAGWDRAVLHTEFGALLDLLPPIGLDLTITGFSLGEIDQLEADHGPPTPEAEDTVSNVQGAVVSRPGDVWQLGRHRVACGDARSSGNLERLMNGTSARMVFTDPPYNVRIRGHVQGRGQIKHREFAFAAGEMTERQYIAFLKAVFSNVVPHCTNGAIAFVCIDWRHIGELLRAARKTFSEYKSLVVWNKTSPGQGSFYRSQHELIGVFKIAAGDHVNSFGLGQHGRTRSNVWTYPGGNSFHAGRMDELAMHPTVKPVALVADALRDCSMRGEVVLDPFLGSGTTVLAAEKVGRQAFGLEIDPAYIDVAVRRWQGFTRADAVLAGEQRTFEEVAAERTGIATAAPSGRRGTGGAAMKRRSP